MIWFDSLSYHGITGNLSNHPKPYFKCKFWVHYSLIKKGKSILNFKDQFNICKNILSHPSYKTDCDLDYKILELFSVRNSLSHKMCTLKYLGESQFNLNWHNRPQLQSDGKCAIGLNS